MAPQEELAVLGVQCKNFHHPRMQGKQRAGRAFLSWGSWKLVAVGTFQVERIFHPF